MNKLIFSTVIFILASSSVVLLFFGDFQLDPQKDIDKINFELQCIEHQGFVNFDRCIKPFVNSDKCRSTGGTPASTGPSCPLCLDEVMGCQYDFTKK